MKKALRPICWLFGHKWKQIGDWYLALFDGDCTRCGYEWRGKTNYQQVLLKKGKFRPFLKRKPPEGE